LRKFPFEYPANRAAVNQENLIRQVVGVVPPRRILEFGVLTNE
jgi:hypothetical protein